MIVLDTNVLSELMKTEPHANVDEWVSMQRTEGLEITVITVAEIISGLAVMPSGRKRDGFRASADAALWPFSGRVLSFDESSAFEYADVLARRRSIGWPIGIPDAMIAAICRQHGAILATRNTKDFLDTGVDLIDPREDIHD